MSRLKMAAVVVLTVGAGGAVATGPQPLDAMDIPGLECAPRLACMEANNWACIGGGVQFNKCNQGTGDDVFDIICVLP